MELMNGNIPSDWDATPNGSKLVLNGHRSTNSQYLSVIYTASDNSKYYDTIVVHFSDVEWTPTNNMPDQTMYRHFEEKADVNNGFTLSPNPAAQNVQITFDHFESNAKIEIFDINGRLVKTYDCTNPQFEINVSNLLNGLYIIRAKMGDQTFTQKLSVIH